MAVVLYFLRLLCLGAGIVLVSRHLRTRADQRKPDNVPFVVMLFAVALTIASIAVQIDVEPDGTIKDLFGTAVAVGGVVTVVFGMWLGHRRYRIEEARQHLEIARLEVEQRKSDLESQKTAVETDKRDRDQVKSRIDSMLSVAELLGSPAVAARAGALWTLIDLAAEWPEHAQGLAEMACLYLRQAQDDPARREAQQVVQHLATRHRNLRFDLTGAALADLNIANANIGMLVLTDAQLSGTTTLHRLSVQDKIVVNGAEFTGPMQMRAVKASSIDAKKTSFGDSLIIESTTVTNSLQISEGTITGDATLVQVDVGELNCNNCSFRATARLDRVTVHGTASFIKSGFTHAKFEEVSFRGRVVFDQSHFAGSLSLRPNQPLTVVQLWKVTVGAEAQLTLPPEWRVDIEDGENRYLARSVSQ